MTPRAFHALHPLACRRRTAFLASAGALAAAVGRRDRGDGAGFSSVSPLAAGPRGNAQRHVVIDILLAGGLVDLLALSTLGQDTALGSAARRRLRALAPLRRTGEFRQRASMGARRRRGTGRRGNAPGMGCVYPRRRTRRALVPG